VKSKQEKPDCKKFRLKAEGLLAQALERGTEHLDGILYTDHLRSSEKRFEAIKEEDD
jgi:peptide deformylase